MYRKIYGKYRKHPNQNALALQRQKELISRRAETYAEPPKEEAPTPTPVEDAPTPEPVLDDKPEATEVTDGDPVTVIVEPAEDEVEPKPEPEPVPESDLSLTRSSSLPVRRPRRYGNGRNRGRAHERDSFYVEHWLDENGRRELEELRRLEKEKEEKARLEADKLEKLKEEVLLVESINEHIEKNTQEHNTDRYECTEADEDPQLVVRRGQEFNLTFTFQRPYDKEADDLYLVFSIGESPNVHKKTSARIKLREDDNTNYMEGNRRRWGARIAEQSDNTLTVAVYSPPNAVIGEWEYSVRTVKDDDEYEYAGQQDIVLLLNPWCPDDQVYMEETNDLNEYILNETGAVFRGSAKRFYSSTWNYGQFQKGILDISLQLLRMANDYAVSSRMSDPVYIGRALSRVLNSSDEGGVLTGRWDGNYEDGNKPLSWKGSPAILNQFRETREPVKYGQCWVFSHLLTTVARALGLPARSVTNFASAHDTDATMTIDKYIDDEGEDVDSLNSDSVWNFHVWNEVWMHRPDLDKTFNVEGKYDGWQAVDATPQELSEYVFQCGPSPLAAIKLGEVNVGYDTKFIFGEVNAERCTWLNNDPLQLVKRDTKNVGKAMSTKYPDGKGFKKYSSNRNQPNARLDVTNLYKAAEGSAEERQAVENAVEEGKFGDVLCDDSHGLELSLLDEELIPPVGEDFVLKLKAQNNSSEAQTITVRANVRPANYWGSLIGKKKISRRLYAMKTLEPGESEVYELPVESEEYLKLCDDALAMRVSMLTTIKGCKDPVFMSEDFSIECPDITLEGPGEDISTEETHDLKVTIKNPLNRELTNCVLKLDGSVFVENDDFELKHSVYVKKIGTLQPLQEETIILKSRPMAKPRRSKERELSVTLDSKELPNMEGSHSMTLK